MAKVFMQGNQAMAESAIRAGCKLFFGYPITPSSEVPEYYARVMRERPEEGVTFIQAETEVSAFNMVAGAVATGHRAMTATSGPGFSLGQEAMSYMAAAASSTIFANAVSVIGWGNLILVWFGLLVCGVIVALPYKRRNNQ